MSEVHDELSQLLVTMDVPAMRRDVASTANVLWLGRNLSINNSDHENFQRAMTLLRTLIVGMSRLEGTQS